MRYFPVSPSLLAAVSSSATNHGTFPILSIPYTEPHLFSY